MSTIDEQNAVYDDIHSRLIRLIHEHVPGFFQSQVASFLEGPEGKRALIEAIKAGLDDAERIRAKAAPK